MPGGADVQGEVYVRFRRRGVLLLGSSTAAAILLTKVQDVEAATPLPNRIPGYDDPAYDGDLPPVPRTWTRRAPPWRTGRRRVR